MLALGVYLGYPICCVAAFCTGDYTHYHADWIGRMEQMPLYGTGFIPCRRCAEEKTADELCEYIEAHRLSPVAFPEDDAGLILKTHGFKDAYGSGRIAEALHKALKELVGSPQPA